MLYSIELPFCNCCAAPYLCRSHKCFNHFCCDSSIKRSHNFYFCYCYCSC
ncbi:hypothetical protein M8C21_010975 [Ambrosia artemisiifolia]|uniref:Uncharacterized protein n=1 Tax=Ambrosia artemisiifolia TaxID=4212 RepID=A0AAD5BQU4_AMBAR|nr:hypothetical protein M8C21_010975 [Ambrosia artemisiifolia]